MIKKCLSCKNPIDIKPSQVERKKFCSTICHDSWRRGKPCPAFTEQHKTNISKAAKTRTLTEEGRGKISESRKLQYKEGRAPQMFQKGHEVKKGWVEACRKANLGNKYHLGFKHTEETKKKCAEGSLRGRLKQSSNVNPSSIEVLLYEYLNTRNVVYKSQEPLGIYITDALISHLKLVIEADGDYWHSSDKAKKRDKRKDDYIKSLGMNVVRIPESKFKNKEYIKVLDKVLTVNTRK